MSPRERVLIVEDEAIVALDLRRQVEAVGHTVTGAVTDADQVLAAVRAQKPTVVLMDVRLQGDTDGITLAEEIVVCEDIPVIFLTAYSDRWAIERAAKSSGYGYLTKPVSSGSLVATIELAVEKHRDLKAHRTELGWLHAALNAVEVAMVGFHRNGTIQMMNRAATRMTGSTLIAARSSTPSWAVALTELKSQPERQPLSLASPDGSSRTVWVRKFTFKLGSFVLLEEASDVATFPRQS